MESSSPINSRVAVLGLGYVGCVSAACLAHLGHTVTGIDKDEHKVQAILDKIAPFYEPGLEDLIRERC
jgi:UDP-glucose 6-dehydrogenase